MVGVVMLLSFGPLTPQRRHLIGQSTGSSRPLEYMVSRRWRAPSARTEG